MKMDSCWGTVHGNFGTADMCSFVSFHCIRIITSFPVWFSGVVLLQYWEYQHVVCLCCSDGAVGILYCMLHRHPPCCLVCVQQFSTIMTMKGCCSKREQLTWPTVLKYVYTQRTSFISTCFHCTPSIVGVIVHTTSFQILNQTWFIGSNVFVRCCSLMVDVRLLLYYTVACMFIELHHDTLWNVQYILVFQKYWKHCINITGCLHYQTVCRRVRIADGVLLCSY